MSTRLLQLGTRPSRRARHASIDRVHQRWNSVGLPAYRIANRRRRTLALVSERRNRRSS